MIAGTDKQREAKEAGGRILDCDYQGRENFPIPDLDDPVVLEVLADARRMLDNLAKTKRKFTDVTAVLQAIYESRGD